MQFPEASTQYNDLEGSAALDERGAVAEISDLAESKGLELEEYGPVLGFQLSGVEDPHHCAVYVADKSEMEGLTVAEYAEQHDGAIPVVKVGFSATSEELTEAIKRLEVIVFKRGGAMTSTHITNQFQLP